MSIDDRFSEQCERWATANAAVENLIAAMKSCGMAGFVTLIEQDRALIVRHECQLPGFVRAMRHFLRPEAALYGGSRDHGKGVLTAEEIALIMRDVSAPTIERAKPWINPTPWKRGRKAQRMRA